MTFSVLSEAEVRAKYRRAGEKSEMLKILCELTCSTKEEMQAFLGLEVVPKPPKGRKQVVYIDNERARALYDQGMSDRQIANALGVTRRGVLDWRHRNRLLCHEQHDMRIRKSMINEIRAEMLYKKGMSDQRIADEIGATKSAVRSWRRRTNRPGHGVSKTQFKPREAECERLYMEGMVDGEIAQQLGVSISAVARWRSRNGLRPNGKQGRSAMRKEEQ